MKFKLEVGITTDELIRIGHASRLASGADYLVANTLAMTQGPNAGAWLIGPDEPEWMPREQLGQRLKRLVTDHLDLRSSHAREPRNRPRQQAASAAFVA